MFLLTIPGNPTQQWGEEKQGSNSSPHFTLEAQGGSADYPPFHPTQGSLAEVETWVVCWL